MGRNVVQPFPEVSTSQLQGRDKQPWFLTFRPNVAVAAGAVVTMEFTVSERDFVWTHIGFTSTLNGVPLMGQPFRLMVQDVNYQKLFGNQRFDLSSVTGGINGIGLQPMFQMSVEWRFTQKTSVRVELENAGGLASIPTLTLHGYFD